MACQYSSALISLHRRIFVLLSIVLAFVISAASVQAQTATYYLHKENSSTTGQFQLKTALPDATALTIQSAELRNQPNGDYLIKAFDTQAGVPNSPGVIPAGLTVNFKLWMRKTANFGTMYARVKLLVNNASGAAIADCSTEPFGPQVGSNTSLTTTLTAHSFTCSTTADVTMSASDRFYLWVGVKVSAIANDRVKAELKVEQGADSNVVIPIPGPRPTISDLSPSSGPIGSPVIITGSNFGATQGASVVTFNGVMASPTSWSNTRIDAQVPVGAKTGPVVVTSKVVVGYQVKSVVGNAVNYSVTSGSVAGTIIANSTGAPISAAFVEALESGVFISGGRTSNTGEYSFTDLKPGTYDIRVSADGYKTLTSAGIVVSLGSTSTVNASLHRPGTISGRVTKSDGITAIPHAAVKVYQATTLVGRALTNSTGDYTVDNLAPVTSRVHAAAPGYQSQVQSGVAVSEQTVTTSNFVLIETSHTASIKYGYDDLGRLVAVEDKIGEAARYLYDASGNLLNISRHLPTQLSILEFTPRKGIEGTVVRIAGTGFSATTTENTVSFNGVAATINSANPSQLVVTVPAGVSTGPITVTTSLGSAATTDPFILDTSGPTITSFSPTIADPNGTLTISGTNFDPAPSRNAATVGMARAPIASGSATDLSVTLSFRTGSGKVKVATPNGTATSAQDFFSPLGGTAATVDFTGRMAIGETRPLTISTPNKRGLMIFDAVAGQRVGLHVTNSIPSSSDYLIYNPDGSILIGPRSVGANSTSWADASRQTSIFGNYDNTFPQTGTYTISLDPTSSTATGTASLRLQEIPADASYFIFPSGPTKTVITPAAGQNAVLTFFGIAGHRISMRIANSTYGGGCCFGTVYVFDPNGVRIAEKPLDTNNDSFVGRFLDTVTLKATGTYTLVVDPSQSWTGRVDLTLYDVPPDITGPVTPGGPVVNITTAVPGQDARLTFNGTAGQRVSFHTRNISIREVQPLILKPDGTTLRSEDSINLGGSAFLDTMSLPTTGTYTVWLNANTTAGNMTATLYDIPADITTTVNINDAPFAVPINVPGQNGNVFFNGTAGQLVTVRMTSNTFHPVAITLIKPDGTTLASASSSNASFNLAQKSLPVTGLYRISVNPVDILWTNGAWTPNTGTVSVAATSA